MNRRLWILFTCCCAWGFFGCSAGKEIKMEIGYGWQFRQLDTGVWLSATVPGTVHTDLLANRKIKDPFYRMNEAGVQWVDKVDWEYQTIFKADRDILKKHNQWLTFNGLDTYADVYLNDVRVGSTNNMFRTWKFYVTGKLKPGDNKLRIIVYPLNKTNKSAC